MNVAPATSFEAVIDTGEPGIVGQISVEANDNVGATVIAASTAGITELAAGVYSATGRTAPATQGQYTLIWKHAGEVLGVEDLVVTFTAPGDPVPGPGVTAYATTDELARILNITPSAAQTVALQRVLDSAALEINAFLGRAAPFTIPYPALVVEVNLERAVDHWKAEQSPFGIVMGGDTVSYSSRNSWRRHAYTLLPLKEGFGVG